MYLPFLSLLSQKVYLTFEGTVPAENANKKLRLAGEQCKVTGGRLYGRAKVSQATSKI